MAAPTGPMVVSMRLAIDTREIAKIVDARGSVASFGEASASAGAQARVLSAAIEDQLAAVSASASGTDALAVALDAARAATLSAAQASQASAQATASQTAAMTALTGALQASVRTEGARAAAASQAAADIVAARKVEAQAAAEARRAAVDEATVRAAADRVAADRATALAATQARVAADQARVYQQRVAQWETERSAARAAAAASEQAAQAETARVTAVRDAYVPLHAETRIYRESLREIRAAEARGDLTSRQAAAAIRAEKDAYADLVRAQRAHQAGGVAGQGLLAPWQRQQLMAQGFDVFTSLGSGMNPATVAIQQGPQIIQALGGFRPALAAVTAALTGTTGAITAATAAVIAGAAAWQSYLSSVKAVETAASGIGRNAGATPGQLESIARDNAGPAGVSVKTAREMETVFLSAQRIGSQYFGEMIHLSRDFGATIGTDAVGGAQKLADILKDPGKGAQSLARDYGLLTGAQARYIEQLVAQGREEEARQEILSRLPAVMASADQSMTAMERRWDQLGTMASNAWDFIGRSIDRAESGASGEERLRELDAMIARARVGGTATEVVPGQGVQTRALPALEQERAQLQAALAESQGAAAARQQAAVTAAAGSQALTIADASPATADARQRLALEQQIAALRAGQAGLEGDEAARVQSALEAKTRALDALNTKQARQNELARLDAEIARERNPARVAELTARRDALKIGEQEIDNADAARQVEAARQRAEIQAQAQIESAARDRAEAAQAAITAAETERATIGKSAGDIAAAQFAVQQLAEAKKRAGAARVVSADEIAEIQRLAAEIGAAVTQVTAARVAAETTFQRAQIGRDPIEQAVQAGLRASGLSEGSPEWAAEERRLRDLETARRAQAARTGSPANADADRRRALELDLATLREQLPSQSGAQRQETGAAIEAATRALRALETQQARNLELDRLDLAIQKERDPIRRADLQTRRDALSIGAQQLSDEQVRIDLDRARARNDAQAAADLAEISRARATAAAEEVAAAGRQTAAIDATAGAIARADAAARMLAEAKERAGSYEAISPGERANIERYADAIGAATDRLAAARLRGDLAFERAQLDRSPTEQRVAETLRSAGVDPSSAAGQEAASRIREIEGIKAQREALGDLRDDLSDYLDKVRESGDAWAAAGDLAEATLNRILKALQDEALNKMLGLPSAATGGGILGLFGFGQQAQTSQPPASTAAQAATGAPLMLLPAAQVAQGTSVASAAPAASAASVAASMPAAVARWAPQVTAEATRAGVDPALALAVLRAESAGNAGARSGAGAIGLMQLMPGTAGDLGVNPYDPGENIRGGVAYLAQMQRRYGGDQRRMLAAYNWGPGRVDRWSGDVGALPDETRAYIGRIEGYMGAGNGSGAAAAIDQLATSATGAASATDGLQSGFETISSAFQSGSGSLAQAAGGMTGAATQLADGADAATTSAQGLFGAIGSGLDNIISGIGSALSGGGGGNAFGGIASMIASIWPFAAGGVMTARGAVPLRAYAAGGIANTPQVALYGEGDYAEAYVPLPDGRSIPVTMRGGRDGSATTVALTQLAGQLGAIQGRLATAATASAGASGARDGSGSRDIPVTVIDNAGVKVTSRESRDASGNRRLEVVLDEQVAKAVTLPGSRSRKAIAASQAVRRR